MEGFSASWGAPGWLWALLLVGLLVAVDARVRGRAITPPARRVAALVVRFTVLACLVVALARPTWSFAEEARHLVFVVDASTSIADARRAELRARLETWAAEQPATTRFSLVTFDGRARVHLAGGSREALRDAWPSAAEPREDGSDLPAGLATALSTIPHGMPGLVVLASDGHSTAPSAIDPILAEARARRIRIDTLALDPGRPDPSVIEVVLAPPSARPGATVEGRVLLDAGAEGELRGRVTVALSGEPIATVPVAAGPPSDEVRFAYPLPAALEPGPRTVTAELEVAGHDPDPQNNRASATLLVGPPPRVRIFAGRPGEARAIARVLEAERMVVEVVDLAAPSSSSGDFSGVDLVVLVDAPAAALPRGPGLSRDLLERLRHFVDRGGGLLAFGGAQAYDLGGYDETPLARLLPVELDDREVQRRASAALVMVLDRSGSMAASAGVRRTKMSLAGEGAVASMGLLRPFDRVGVMSVDERVRWDLPIQPVQQALALTPAILGIQADGGGIFVYTALATARRALSGDPSAVRHVILFSDAADAEEKLRGQPFGGGTGAGAVDLAAAMRADGMTLSVIGIGTPADRDVAFLRSLAQAGGGRFYLTGDATELRALFVEETERMMDSSVLETAFSARAGVPHPATAGIDVERAPALLGIHDLQARPTAQVLLFGPDERPLLTWWRYGLGHVFAWASDAGERWSRPWLRWPGYPRLWTQVARFAVREADTDDAAIEVERAGGRAFVRVLRRDEHGMTLDEQGLRATVEVDEQRLALPLRVVEPGLWEAALPSHARGSVELEVREEGTDALLATRTLALASSPEFRPRAPDLATLQRVADATGGTVAPDHLTVPAATRPAGERRPGWRWASWLALLLLPVDAWLRRPARVR